MTYEKKAPAFANVDDVKEKFFKHFGRIYDNLPDFLKILKEEEADSFILPGQFLEKITMQNGRTCDVHIVRLDDESFHEQSFYLQALLPFFIDGASPIEPSIFWKYFLIYDSETKELIAYTTVYEAHLDACKFRAKIS